MLLSQGQNIIVYLFPLISLIGVVANILAFIIFSRKKFQNTIFSIYFRFFIIFDTLSLMLPINKLLEMNFNIIIADISDSLCKFRYYYAYVSVPISGWTLVVISIDRFLSVSCSGRFHFRKKKGFHITMAFIILIFNLSYYIPNLFYYIETKTNYSNETNLTIEYSKCQNPGFALEIMDLFQSTLVPFLLMIFFSSITIKSLFESRIRANLKNGHRKDIRFAITSISLNILFLVMNLPYFIVSILNQHTNIFENNFLLFKFIISTTLGLLYSNAATVFFVNILVNRLFRNEFKKIFNCNKN